MITTSLTIPTVLKTVKSLINFIAIQFSNLTVSLIVGSLESFDATFF